MSRLGMIMDNPLIVRAFRIGFRPGRGNFYLTWWALALVAILGLHVAFEAVVGSIDNLPGFAGRALALLVMFTVATFVISGLQRMLVAFSLELEQGSFEFLHLSTMKPSTMVFGFLFAGQMPGYWILLATFPLMLIAGIVAGMKVVYLVALVAAIAGFVLFFSLLFMLTGFWMRQVVDLRGLAVILTVVGVLVVWGVTSILATKWDLIRYPGLLGVIPVGLSLWKRGFAPPGAAGEHLPFFGMDMPIELHALFLYGPLAMVIYASLVGSLRYRERRPLSNRWGFFLVAWLQLMLTGLTWGPQVPAGTKLTWLAVLTFPLVALLVTHRCVRSVTATGRVIEDTRGKLLAMLVHPHAPPFLLVAALSITFVVFAVVQELGTGTGGSLEPLAWFGVPLTLLVHVLLVQYLYWRHRSWALWSWLFKGCLVYLPLLAYGVMLFLENQAGGLFTAVGAWLRTLLMVSPLAQSMAMGVPELPGTGLQLGAETAGTVLSLGGYLLAAAGLGFLCVRQWRALVAEVENPAPEVTPEPGPASPS